MARSKIRMTPAGPTVRVRPPETDSAGHASSAAPDTPSVRPRKTRTAKKSGKALPASDWRTLDEEALLAQRIRDLGLTIEGSPLEPRIRRFHSELEEKGLAFKPPCYLADEWLTPDGMPIIGIPFYLAHPRLTALEKKMMLEAEGESEAWCLKLLRHEAGHAFNYAYRLHARKGWKETFGDIAAPYYHVTYDSKPYSKRFVIHLEDHYAQAHPDEDFAETFAVWATPGSDWRTRYRGWPALKKLEYLDGLMAAVGAKPPLVKRAEQPWSAARMASTLQGFYDRKRKYLGSEFPGYYDPGLKRVFALPDDGAQPEKAVHFLRRHRANLLRTASAWAPQRKYDVGRFLDKLIARCAHLDLRLRRAPEESLLDLTAFVTAVLITFRRFNGVHESK